MNRLEELIGKTITNIIRNKDDDDDDDNGEELIFEFSNGDKCRFFHEQDCCEEVSIEDIIGDLIDLLNTPLINAEEVVSDSVPSLPSNHPNYSCCDSCTWTFYKFATTKGFVTIRWYGASNGCYSETVSYEYLPRES
jgi:hypothetical protein